MENGLCAWRECVRRREFVTLVAGAATAWPLAVRAQQPALPVVGLLGLTTPEPNVGTLRALRQGLKEVGRVEGETFAMEYRWAENRRERLPALAAELVRRNVRVIVAMEGGDVVLAAKGATGTIPIIFVVSSDPVSLGLVASIARPGGNVTGINFVSAELVAKRLEILRELVPGATRIAVLVNPASPAATETTLREIQPAAQVLGLKIRVFEADRSEDIDSIFANLASQRPDALFVANGAFLTTRRIQLVHLATRHAIPATYPGRQYVDVGGLMSYGANLLDAWREGGVYTGRILKGTTAADLPVMQSSKLELVINNQTARILGLTVPPALLVRADEVID
jgi:putative tryptophan/tyrosine transport system substrate-binding protein